MATERIYQPGERHDCDLEGNGRFVPNDLRPGTVEVCCECGRAWVYDPIPWERTYRRLRLWPFDRAQRAALRRVVTSPEQKTGEDE